MTAQVKVKMLEDERDSRRHADQLIMVLEKQVEAGNAKLEEQRKMFEGQLARMHGELRRAQADLEMFRSSSHRLQVGGVPFAMPSPMSNAVALFRH